MMKILNFFRRLQWKLTMSYSLVTAGTVVVLAGLVLGIALYFETQVPTRTHDSFYWSKTGFQDNIPFLLDEPEKLKDWLERVRTHGFIPADFQSYTVRETLDYANTLVLDKPIYVLDAELNLIAASPPPDPLALGKPFEPREAMDGGLEKILEAALVGDKDYFAQSALQPGGNYVVAFPLRESDGDPVSAIVIYQVRPVAFATPSNLNLYATFFGLIAFIVFVLALPVGAIFGWLVSIGLRKRLTRLSTAAQAWSQGDFSVLPRDRSGDEIGELTRALNSMAEQLQTHIHTRDELARVEERNRLARELHDTVKQQTYAARMQLTAVKNLLPADPQAAAEGIETVLQLNRETQLELKLIIDELRPAALDGKGLAQALAETAARWQAQTGIPVGVTVSGERSLPLDVEQVLYRVFQESLSNIARHAEASQVDVSLQVDPERVTLTIRDDGRGFDPQVTQPGTLGLAGMKQRMAEIGGTFKVESRLAVGTKITAGVQLAGQSRFQA